MFRSRLSRLFFFFGPLDTSFKLASQNEKFIFLLRSHVLLNNSDLFKSNSGKESNSELSIFSEKNIPFYPIIRDCETMFFGKDYSLKNDTRPTIQNAYVNRAVDCFNITIITNNLENAAKIVSKLRSREGYFIF